MDSVDFFDDIDIVEVSRKTLIDKKNIIYLKNEEFDKLDKAKGVGFIKIIEREYRVDLSDKKERFLTYLKEHGRDRSKEIFIPPPKPQKKVFPKIILVLLLVLVGVGVGYIVYTNISSFSSSKQIALEQNEVVTEAKNISGIDINDTNDTYKSPLMNDEANDSKTLDQNDTSIQEEQNTTDDTISNSKSTTNDEDQNKTVSLVDDANQTLNEQNITKAAYTVTIIPKSKIWIGLVDLSTYKKRSYIKDANLTIDMKNDFMIATGHGRFKIEFNGKVVDFNSKGPVRLLFRDGNMSEIDKQKFIDLNRGKYW